MSFDIKSKRVLVVEDDPVSASVMEQFLLDIGCHVYVCNNGKDALDKIEDSTSHLILMDLNMPEMDGWKVADSIRKKDKYKDCPIVAVTAHDDEDSRQKTIDAGFNDVIVKPIQLAELKQAVEYWLKCAQGLI